MKIYFKDGCVNLNRYIELYGGFELVLESGDDDKNSSLSVEVITDKGARNKVVLMSDTYRECLNTKRDIMRRYLLDTDKYKIGDVSVNSVRLGSLENENK